jgi:chemotaxis protein CheZ
LELKKSITEPEQIKQLDQISANSADVFEACSFQDITGQRITKVVNSVTYVEDRVNALINVRGKEEIERIEVQPEIEMTEEEKLLRGPALDGEGITQDEIDKLFD